MLDDFDKVEVLYEFKETLMPEDSHQTQQIFMRCFRLGLLKAATSLGL